MLKKKIKILITGNKGFIGSKICKILKKNYQDNIDFFGYDLVEGNDILDKFKLDKLFEAEQFDMVLHLAALAGVRRSEDYPQKYSDTNIIGTRNLIEMCKNYKVDKFIFFSSSSVLGGSKNKKDGLKEDDLYQPQSFYANSKAMGEFLVKASGLDYFIIRPFTVYGENGRKDMVIYKWINQIKAKKPISFFGDGKTSRGYTYVEDLAQATIDLIQKLKQKKFQEIIHLGGSEIIQLQELLKLFQKHTKKKNIKFTIDQTPMPDADVVNSHANTKKAKNLINFSPKPRFKKIIEDILQLSL